MSKIIILDELTANQIAAGEVVERPASVVKELVENAIDAGSARIEVAIEDGGIRKIRVTDNGSGMDREDSLLAFQRHATSKIRGPEELAGIRTLGFRGEALPSIAAVARVTVTTRTIEDLSGTFVRIRGGVVEETREVGCAQGTSIIVENLFYNTPARRKFLRSATTEAGLVSDVILRLALAHPEIAFSLASNNRTVLATPGNGSLLDTMVAVYGLERARQMIPFQGTTSLFQITGFLGKPQFARANRSYQTFLVNRRYIKSPLLSNALEEGYHTLLTTGRHPAAVVALTIDPALVDVNVHPTKMEVRFSQEKEIAHLLAGEVARALKGQEIIPGQGRFFGGLFRSLSGGISTPGAFPDSGYPASSENLSMQGSLPNPGNLSTKGYPPNPAVLPESPSFREEAAAAGGAEGTLAEKDQALEQITLPLQGSRPYRSPAGNSDWEIIRESYGQPEAEGEEGAKELVELLPPLTPIGQIDATYIVAQGPEGMFIIDQHAAHERILYEKFMEAVDLQDNYRQELLLPLTLELTHREAQVLIRHILVLAELGFTIEHFSGDTFLVRSFPQGVAKGREKEFFLDLLAQMEDFPGNLTAARLREKVLITMACKGALKAGQKLSLSEIAALLDALANTKSPYTCPHGRPTLVHLSPYELEKKFKRKL